MKRLLLLCACFVAFSGCLEKQVRSTSISLRVILADQDFDLSFVEEVHIYLQSADSARPLTPAETAATSTTFDGIPMEVQASAFVDGGPVETRIRIARNPFSRLAGAPLASFSMLFFSQSAGSNPMKILVNLLRDGQVIASGTATKTIEGSDIVNVQDERRQVEVQVRCATGFSCSTGNRAPALTQLTTPMTIAEGETQVIDLQATDPDGHAVTFAVQNAPSFVTLDVQASRLTVAPTFASAGTYSDIVITATDAGSPALSTSQTISIVVSNVNRAPSFVTVGSLDPNSQPTFTIRENERFAITLTASDPDPTGNTLSYEMSGLPEDAVLNATSGALLWTPSFDTVTTSEGTKSFTVEFKVKDSEQVGQEEASVTATIIVENVNRAPVFTTAPQNRTGAEGGVIDFPIEASDADGDTITYSATWSTGESGPPSLPDPGTALNSSTGAFAWTPGPSDFRASPYKARFTASDGAGGSVTQEITISVNNTNLAPTVSVVEVAAVGESRCSTDSGSLACTVEEGKEVAFAVTVTEDSDDSISTLAVSPDTLTGSIWTPAIDKRSATFRWTPSFDYPSGVTTVTFTAIDQGNAQGSVSVPVTVVDVNQAPVMTLTENVATTARCSGSELLTCFISEEEALTINVAVSDDADETITTLTRSGPSDFSGTSEFSVGSDNKTATFVFTPSDLDSAVDPYVFTFEALDSKGKRTTKTLSVFVANVNRAPAITATEVLPDGQTAKCSGAGTVADPLNCSIPENYELKFELAVTDADRDDTVNLFTVSAPTITDAFFTPTITNTAATFTWTPNFTKASATPYPVTFSATDGNGESGQLSVNITVTDVNQAPTLKLISGTAGGQTACRIIAPSEWECFVDAGQGNGSTLALQLEAKDPDDPNNPNAIDLTFFSSTLPQIGPVFDAQRQIFSFLVEDTSVRTYDVTFEVADKHATDPLITTLDVHISANFKNVPPDVQLLGCEGMVLAGESTVCTVKVNDQDPRQLDQLTLSASFVNGGNFVYDKNTLTGTFTMVAPITASGAFQVDFTASDGQLERTVPYLFFVQRSDIMTPFAFPIVGGRVLDMVYSAPYLYTVDEGFLTVYLVSDAGATLQPLRSILVPNGAKRMWLDAPNSNLYVLGEALKVYSLSPNPANPVFTRKYNIPDGLAANSVTVRTFTSGQTTDTLAFVDFGSLNQIDVIRFADIGQPIRVSQVTNAISLRGVACNGAVSGQECPADWTCTVNDSNATESGVCVDAIQRVAAVDDSHLVAMGFKGLRIFSVMDSPVPGGEGGTIILKQLVSRAENAHFNLEGTLSDLLFGAAVRAAGPDLDSNRFGYTNLGPDTATLTVPMRNPSTGEGFVGRFAVQSSGEFLGGAPLAGPTLVPGGGVPNSAARLSSTGPSYLAGTGTADILVYRDNETFATPIDLMSSGYNDIIVTPTLAFASTPGVQGAGSPFLVSLDITVPDVPVPAAQLDLSVRQPGQPIVYTPSAGTSLLYIPRFGGSIDVFEYPSATAPVGMINLPADTVIRHLLQVGPYLVGHSGGSQFPGKKNFVFYDLSTNALSPTALPTSGFEIPVSSGPLDSGAGKGWVDTSGNHYIYFAGDLCEPTCTGGLRSGLWLLQLTPTSVNFVKYFNADAGEGLGAFSRLGRMEVNGNALYRTYSDTTDGFLKLAIFDITDPQNPVAMGTHNIVRLSGAPNQPTQPVASVTGVHYKDGVILVTLSPSNQWDTGASLFEVSTTDPFAVLPGANVVGLGDVLAGAITSRTRAYVSSAKLGILRLNLTDIVFPRIDGGTEAPKNAVGHIVVDSGYLVSVEPTNVVVFQLAP